MSTHTSFNAHYRRDGTIIIRAEEGKEDVVKEQEPVKHGVSSVWSVSALSNVSRPRRKRASSIMHSVRTSIRCPRVVSESLCFAGTFTAVFLLLFVSLNFSSFRQVFTARLFPNANEYQRAALHAITDPTQRNALLSVPRLPTSGPRLTSLVASALNIAPPDTRLIIPKIGKNIPIVPVTDAALLRGDFKTFEKDVQHALRFGAVHYPGTARPGQRGNVFITAHSSYNFFDAGRFKDAFALLGDLEVGDEYSIYSEGQLYRYRVAKKFEVSPRDVSVLDQPLDRRMATLMTCTPIGTTLRRLIVQADEVDPMTGEMIVTEEHSSDEEASRYEWEGELPV